MRRRRLPWFPILGLLCLVPTAAVGSAVERAREQALPSETCRGLFLVPIRVGGERGVTLDLVLDTGSSRTYLDPAAIRRAAGGRVAAGKATLVGARAGSFVFDRIEARALPMNELGLALGREIDGILGFREFKNVLLTLDYPERQVRVSRGRLPRPDGRTVFRYRGRSRPRLSVDVGGRRVSLVLDSGATTGFELSPRDRLAWLVAPRPATLVWSFYGLSVDRGVRVDGTLRFGPTAFEDPVVLLTGRERNAGQAVLRHFVLTFDQATKRIRMEPQRAGPVRMEPMIGWGLGVRPRPDASEVVRVFPGTPAEAAGLRPGDRIVAIDGKAPREFGCDDPGGDTVGRRRVVTVLRDGVRRDVELETAILVP